jgi:hypothetical protein
MRWEIYPVLGLCAGAIVYYKYQTEFLNVIGSNIFKLQALSDSQEKFVARKIASLLKY